MRRDPTASKDCYIDTSEVDLLNSRRLPARLTLKQVALLLAFQLYELRLLMGMGRLESLGSPRSNSRKYFSRAYIEKLAEDYEWLNQSTEAVAKVVKKRNVKYGRGFAKSIAA